MKNYRGIFSVAFVILMSVSAGSKTWTPMPSGAKATIGDCEIELSFYTPVTVRVTKTPAGTQRSFEKSLSVTAKPDSSITVSITETGNKTGIYTSGLRITADNTTGQLSFSTPSGKLLTRENGKPVMKVAEYPEANGLTVSQTFYVAPKERLYGLGSLAELNLSRRNFSKRLLPGNIDDGFPVVQSSKGYGIVWDNYSPTFFEDNDKGMTFTSEIADGVDYYFINGDGSSDKVIAQMREISGDVPMFPLWTYGYWQSRERYKTQHEPTGVVKRYRQQGIPIDGIIQDWQYWGNNYLWNAMEFMNPKYNHPQQMIDSVHDLNAHMIISIWSSFGPMTKPFAELKDKNLLFDIATWPESGIEGWPPRKDYPSGVKVYNAYDKEARDIYWKHLTRIHDMGMDGWWMDSTEPDHFDDKMDFPTGMGSYRRVKGAYPLMTVGGVYDHQRDVDSTKRVFILTRSAWFGQQRYGCNVWTGDVVSTWDMLRKQIPQHLNFTMSGNPHTNSDIGGFFCGRYNMPDGTMAYANPLYGELTTRWTQLGAFTPMMRAHGADSPCEIYLFGKPGETVYDALVDAVKLRYSLLPYTYSTSWDVSSGRGSFMRPLVMDFPEDEEGLEANDRFMFGKSLLVAPIVNAHYTEESATRLDTQADANAGWGAEETVAATGNTFGIDFTKPYEIEIRLPKGTDWFDFFTGRKYKGGKKAVLTADLSTIPVFARAGSIIPLGPDVQYANEKPWENLTIKLFPGADGEFTLYEDEGDNYNYEKGDYTTIPISYNHKDGTLTIGERAGSFPGMLTSRRFTIVNAATGATSSIDYDGHSTSIRI